MLRGEGWTAWIRRPPARHGVLRHVAKLSHAPGCAEHRHEADDDGPLAPEGAVVRALFLGGGELQRGQGAVEGVEAFTLVSKSN